MHFIPERFLLTVWEWVITISGFTSNLTQRYWNITGMGCHHITIQQEWGWDITLLEYNGNGSQLYQDLPGMRLGHLNIWKRQKWEWLITISRYSRKGHTHIRIQKEWAITISECSRNGIGLSPYQEMAKKEWVITISECSRNGS